MKKIVAFNGSPRPAGNTAHLLRHFMEGALDNSVETDLIHCQDLNLKYCQGCLRCNILKRCSISGDDWEEVSKKILDADVLVFAAPVYFHHVPAPMKKMMDRFRSFHHVQITESGLVHTPWQEWKKDFVLILSMGTPDPVDAQPIIELFEFMTSLLGSGNRLHVITATRLAVVKQVIKTEEELETFYRKMKLPAHLAREDHHRNQKVLKACRELGVRLSAD
jgi:putative NADPH-quinone reductase